MIFLDNASTTRVFDEVLSTMSDINRDFFYNPSSLYGESIKISEFIDDSRKTLAGILNVKKTEIYFTSSATESNNWVLNCGFKNKKGNIVISAGEHPSVYAPAMFLKGKGVDVRITALTKAGVVDCEDLEKKLDKDTSLVSIIHCSNETGAINNIAKITSLVRKKSPNALIHSDGVQALCKIDTDLKKMDVDFYTISAHKLGGPKGCAALYIGDRVKIAPFIYGGGQENGLRGGTENTAGIVGFAKATQVFLSRFDCKKTREAYDFLQAKMIKNGWIFNGALDMALPECDNNFHSSINEIDRHKNRQGSIFILSFSYPGIRSEILQHMLSQEGVLIGLGSACSSKTSENRVLAAMGCDKKSIESSIRLSLFVDLDLQQVKTAAEKINNALTVLKQKIRL